MERTPLNYFESNRAANNSSTISKSIKNASPMSYKFEYPDNMRPRVGDAERDRVAVQSDAAAEADADARAKADADLARPKHRQ